MVLKVLEFYSGVGGMHMALNDADVPCKVIGAVDINTTANAVYKHNFPGTAHMQRNIESFTADELDRLQPDVITMSPPCQPFSRLGRQQDVNDARSSSLTHLLSALVRMRRPPRYLLVENVRGFESSSARQALLEALGRMSLSWREFLLTPTQLGVPNSRSRYYLMARRRAFPDQIPPDRVLEEIPYCVCSDSTKNVELETHCIHCGKPVLPSLSKYLTGVRQQDFDDKAAEVGPAAVPTLGQFLGPVWQQEDAPYLLSDRTLVRYSELLDIVTDHSRRCCCFTKGYAHMVERAGSVLQSVGEKEARDAAYGAARQLAADDPRRAACLRPLRLRYFSPREVARLMCFPTDRFSFPEGLTDRQKYRVLGNSVNVRTVAVMVLVMLEDRREGVENE